MCGIQVRKPSIKEIVDHLINILMDFDNVVFAYLYGSFARGEYHKFSDIDVAIYQKKHDTEEYLGILASINIEGREIDLRILNNASPFFRYKVIKEGILLFCKDKKLHEDFVFRTLVEALELIGALREILRLKVQRYDL